MGSLIACDGGMVRKIVRANDTATIIVLCPYLHSILVGSFVASQEVVILPRYYTTATENTPQPARRTALLLIRLSSLLHYNWWLNPMSGGAVEQEEEEKAVTSNKGCHLQGGKLSNHDFVGLVGSSSVRFLHVDRGCGLSRFSMLLLLHSSKHTFYQESLGLARLGPCYNLGMKLG